MDRLGIQSLHAGAPDLRLTGDQTQRGTYTQRRRNQMAYGGIAGLDGRKAYGLGSWFQEQKDKFLDRGRSTKMSNDSINDEFPGWKSIVCLPTFAPSVRISRIFKNIKLIISLLLLMIYQFCQVTITIISIKSNNFI